MAAAALLVALAFAFPNEQGTRLLATADGWRYHYFHLNNDTPGSDDGRGDALWTYPAGLRVGDRVRAGQIIGYMGDSGNSEHSVPHLHFEIRVNGAAQNPRGYLP